jgi:hypothetical protein
VVSGGYIFVASTPSEIHITNSYFFNARVSFFFFYVYLNMWGHIFLYRRHMVELYI